MVRKKLSKKMVGFKTSAFTLAEVLITLAIIGVVAAMTIPTMMQRIQIEEFRIALKKEYSIFTQAVNTLQVQNSTIDTSSPDNFVNDLATQISIQKQGTYSSLTSLPATYNYKCYKSASGTCNNLLKRPGMDGWKTFVTNNGALYTIYINSTSSGCTNANWHSKIRPTDTLPKNNSCVNFFVDVNGDKNPNQLGVDMHVFYLLKQNNYYYVKPSGSFVDTVCSASYPNDYNKSLHCTNRMILGMSMP